MSSFHVKSIELYVSVTLPKPFDLIYFDFRTISSDVALQFPDAIMQILFS